MSVEVDAHFVTLLVDDRELVTSISIQQVVLEASLLLERLRLRVLPFGQNVIILFKIGEEVHGEGVVLVELVPVGALQHFQGLRSTRVLHENIPDREI